MATLQVAPTRHRHTEQFSGILTDQLQCTYLAHTCTSRGREGWEKNQGTNWHANSKLLQQHFEKNCKQATAYISLEVPLLEASGPPDIAGETADQHCFEVNFA